MENAHLLQLKDPVDEAGDPLKHLLFPFRPEKPGIVAGGGLARLQYKRLLSLLHFNQKGVF